MTNTLMTQLCGSEPGAGRQCVPQEGVPLWGGHARQCGLFAVADGLWQQGGTDCGQLRRGHGSHGRTDQGYSMSVLTASGKRSRVRSTLAAVTNP